MVHWCYVVMSYVVIAYPDISQKDLDWVQETRQKNDPIMFRVVKPHVTFIFPTSKLNESILIKHVNTKIVGVKPFSVKFDKTKVVEDDSKTYFHAFLAPSIGFNEIIKLHDNLYTDVLKSELRLDIPFIPHLGIGTNKDKRSMTNLTKQIDYKKLSISGEIKTLTIAKYENNKVQDVAEVTL